MKIIISIILLGIFSQMLFIVYGEKEDHREDAIMFKTLASILFVLVGMKCTTMNVTTYSMFVVIGLVLGAIGDLFMELRHVSSKALIPCFILGAIFFLLGHVVYLKALSNITQTQIYLTLMISSILIFRIIRLIDYKENTEKLFVSGSIYGSLYIIVETLVFVSACRVETLLFATGAFAFLISDIMLILYNFSEKCHDKMIRRIYLLLYYIGQLLIALSILF